MGGVWRIGGILYYFQEAVKIPGKSDEDIWLDQVVSKMHRHHFYLTTASSRDITGGVHMKVFPQRGAGMDIYKSEKMRLSTREVPLTVRSGRCALGERCERLLPGNLVLLDLLVLLLVLLVGLLLVLGDQVVDVGSALSGRDVPGRTSVEDPIAFTLAWLFPYI
jgi:hypothetical protein